tara:strand:- start:209 stop:886 length:678 start_codon:yes stop_codon:yes gene_type:complete
MLYILNILLDNKGICTINTKDDIEFNYKNIEKKSNFKWIKKLFPLFLVTLFITGVMSLLQSILPLDLAKGGIIRPPLIEQGVATLLTLKLILLAIFQWPVGYIFRNKNSSFKFKSCLISLLIGFILLSLSNLLINGYLLVLLAFVPITISLCIFLPSASDSIIKSSPIRYQGTAIALYSQCFGISSLTIPWMSGKLIDNLDTAFHLWLIVSIICIILVPGCRNIK